MKRLVLLSAAVASLMATNGAEARAQGSSQPDAWTTYGASMIATGTDIWVKFYGADAGYTSNLFFVCDVSSNCQQFLFVNNSGLPSPQEVKINHTFAIGEEVIFKLMVGNTGDTWWTGPADRNSDNYAHFATQAINDVTSNATYTVLGGFEDLPGGGDKDHNDLMFEFSNVAVTATPEPASMALMATGLASLGGVVRRRRKQAKES
ncbi:MAG TPA: DUF4114 domain-containing protein [Gemmatimonadaceae bacterium]